VLAYEQLLAEGYASARAGSGTYAARTLAPDAPATRGAEPVRLPSSPHLSRFGSRAVESARGLPSWRLRETPLPYDFRYGRPASGDFPHDAWRRVLARCARRASQESLDYGVPEGLASLRAAIADYASRTRAVRCGPDDVVIVNGSQQGLDLAARVLVDPGDVVVLEEPHYAGARRVFEAAGARVRAVAVDGDGLRVAELPRMARLAYVTPSHQFPTGAVLPAPRRLALLAWAERAGAWLVEDDYDSEYRYAARPVESLQGLDRVGRVLYVGTFSKVLFPSLRLGYVVVPRALRRAFRAAKSLTDTGTSALEQAALAEFIREGYLARHVSRSRARNAARRGALLEAICEHLGAAAEVTGADAGLHVAALAARRSRLATARARARGRGARCRGLSGDAPLQRAPARRRPGARLRVADGAVDPRRHPAPRARHPAAGALTARPSRRIENWRSGWSQGARRRAPSSSTPTVWAPSGANCTM